MSNKAFEEDVIMKTVSKLLAPPIQLFGLYVIMHGHISPGGGFQGGVMIASSFILLTLAFGYQSGTKRVKLKFRRIMEPMGALIFALIGLLCIFLSANFLHYPVFSILPNSEMVATAISVIEIGIGVTVTAVIFSMFMSMGGRKNGST